MLVIRSQADYRQIILPVPLHKFQDLVNREKFYDFLLDSLEDPKELTYEQVRDLNNTLLTIQNKTQACRRSLPTLITHIRYWTNERFGKPYSIFETLDLIERGYNDEVELIFLGGSRSAAAVHIADLFYPDQETRERKFISEQDLLDYEMDERNVVETTGVDFFLLTTGDYFRPQKK